MNRDHMMGFPALASLIADEQPRPVRVTPQRAPLTAEQQAQRRALDVRPPADGWIEWTGKGEVPRGLVDVRFLCGAVFARLDATSIWWDHTGHYADIVAYRVAQ